MLCLSALRISNEIVDMTQNYLSTRYRASCKYENSIIRYNLEVEIKKVVYKINLIQI